MDPDGGSGYTIIYLAPDSTAVNDQGQPIKGPIEQYVCKIQSPVKEQLVRIRYMRDEPIIFEHITVLKEQ